MKFRKNRDDNSSYYKSVYNNSSNTDRKNLCEIELNDISALFDKTIIALRSGNYGSLKQLSDNIIHCASIFQNENTITIAVILYALSKIYSRLSQDSKNATKKIISKIEKARDTIRKGNDIEIQKALKKVIDEIDNVDKKMHVYARKVMEEAGIKKGSKIYEHGVSLSRVAYILGVSQWDLMSYIGNTNVHEFKTESINVVDRVKYAMRLFK